jgi:hypothetical protein
MDVTEGMSKINEQKVRALAVMIDDAMDFPRQPDRGQRLMPSILARGEKNANRGLAEVVYPMIRAVHAETRLVGV